MLISILIFNCYCIRKYILHNGEMSFRMKKPPKAMNDDEDRNWDFEKPGLENQVIENSKDKQMSDDDECDVEPVSEEDNNDESNDIQLNITSDLNQLNWGPVTGNQNNIPFNPNTDFV